MPRLPICAIFFLSGASALIFEALWFQLLGLTLGNSVWATSIVLSSFMIGLAIGNTLVTMRGQRIRNPVRLFALLEVVIGASGFGVILLLPLLTTTLGPVFGGMGSTVLNTIRAGVSFLMLVAPATAMGMTLPILVKALSRKDENFGRVLAILYGCNTLGAAAGVICSELLLVPALGLTGAGVVALALNFVTATTALALSKLAPATVEPARSATAWGAIGRDGIRILIASFSTGFILLALEVLWFRQLLLFFDGFGLNFAVMLMVVLLGIAIGGLLAARWYQRVADAEGYLAPLILCSGFCLLVTYNTFDLIALQFFEDQILLVSIFLMAPVCIISGVAFTMLGRALHLKMGDEIASAGLLTLTNTLGGALGSLVAGLMMIPVLGLELSFFTLALAYGVVGFLIVPRSLQGAVPARRKLTLVAVIALAAGAATFPFGLMERSYTRRPLIPLAPLGEERVYFREGVLQTIQYTQRDFLGEPLYHRLVTNNHSMSATTEAARRYMKLYVYWPIAVRPDARDALLICFGCGSTAKALTDSAGIEHVDIVDISRDVLEASDVVYPDPGDNPINDERVEVHIEDGRFFLQTTKRSYDIVTGEPPPLGHRGVANLYSQEYFQLVYDRLNPGGAFTYWLPVRSITPDQSRSVLMAFTNVFQHSSLWLGSGYDWMMVGVREPREVVSEEEFRRQWQDALVGPEMRGLGFLSAEQLGSLFVADRQGIREWCANEKPLTDDFPHILAYRGWGEGAEEEYDALTDWRRSQSVFATSEHIKSLWPPELISSSAEHFTHRRLVNGLLSSDDRFRDIATLHECLADPARRHLVIWCLESTPLVQTRLATLAPEADQLLPVALAQPDVALHCAARAVFEGRLSLAVQIYARITASIPPEHPTWKKYTGYLAYLLYRADQPEPANAVVDELMRRATTELERQEIVGFARWLNRMFR